MPAKPFLATPHASRRWGRFCRPAAGRLLALLTVLLALSAPAQAETVCGRAYTTVSGNRFYMTEAGRKAVAVRLAWTYAPEQPQNAAPIAKFKLNQWVGGSDVCVDVVSQDAQGRIVGVVKLKGEDINLKLLQEGLAWHYVKYAAKGQDREAFGRYSAAEYQARR